MDHDDIICFAKDYSEDPTSNHHVLWELARAGHRVLWLNSVGTRTPNLGSGRDLKKIVTKLGEFARGPTKVRENLWVFSPLVLPLPHSAAARKLNRAILRATIRGLRLRMGIKKFQLWTFLPNVASYIGTLDESLVVYYCVDEWSMFSYIDDQMVATERDLCARADVVFGVNQALTDAKGKLNSQSHLATHGVAHEQFAAALAPATRVPEDVANLSGPVLGFYGTLQDWVDLPLIAFLAERHPEWNLVLIGTPHVDLSTIEKFPNVHLLGRKPHELLPAYCKRFDVGLIPYVVEERMKYVNPIKLREYLSAGLPVVSTEVPEVARYAQHCEVAPDYPVFEAAVVRALADDSPERRRARSDSMKSETWEHKVAAVRATVEEVKRKKWHSR